jgi:hypothetical protein
VRNRAVGTFDVEVKPLSSGDETPGRFSLAKRFHGDLDGTSRGEMLTAGTNVPGSAAYVAIEKIDATLRGRAGTFVLQHTGTMTRGASQLTITVVPDSGTGDLSGLAGEMSIVIEQGKHSYELEYTLEK